MNENDKREDLNESSASDRTDGALPDEAENETSDVGEIPRDGIEKTPDDASDPKSSEPQPEGEAARPMPTWRFTPVPEEKGGFGRFVAVFGGILAVVLLLLVGTLFLGQSGFRFIRQVETKQTVYVREYDPASGLLTPNEAADRARLYTVAVSVRTAAGGTAVGSGFVWREDGYILTNHHVVEDAAAVQVIFSTGKAVDAAVVGSDADADVAVLRVTQTGLETAPVGQSSMLLTGDDVVAVGTPARLDFAGTATFGKVSCPARIMTFTDETGMVVKKMTLIQTDTSVNPGNSGGPLVDMYGRVVGIVFMKVMTVAGANYDGIGFAIPIDGAVAVAEAILRDGRVIGDNPIAAPRTLLGVAGRGLVKDVWYSDPREETITSSETRTADCTFQMPEDGIYVMSVGDGGAVGRVQVGDIITRIDGLRMYTIYDVIQAVNRRQPGEAVTVTLLRPGVGGYTETEVEIVLTEE